ncbi:hypothetical protein HY948_02280 [Candidatus Gottesmanbacteria bacterium]|nr:hypothetical protein [Candidatus Gottesmanbacteria bacterium]
MMDSGLTLLEIVIVVAILFILAATVIGSFSQFDKVIALSRDAERIVS